jgi:formylglycine-generating enzyme required for sulfatase activity
MAETCNGVDDDCDGIVDNSDPSDPARIRDDMVEIVRGTTRFWIYRYEASRPDATASSAGARETRACSNPGVLPWASVSFAAARAACEAAGKRLCTGAEWQAACEGTARTLYPYGASYAPLTCNGADRDAVPGGAIDNAVAPTGALAMCRTPEGALDLSGNVKEWTNDQRGTVGGSAIHVVRGGSYDSPELGLTCSTDLSRATVDTLLPTLGFRCCSSTAP